MLKVRLVLLYLLVLERMSILLILPVICMILILYQVQLAVNHSGQPVFFTAVHIPRHDSHLFEEFPPVLNHHRHERWLGDLAYVKFKATVITPFKRKKGRRLSPEEIAFNRVHSWYNTTTGLCMSYICLLLCVACILFLIDMNCVYFPSQVPLDR